MSFPRYPSYKTSGVEWWGDMPEIWGIFPAKRSFIRKKELNAGMKCENRLSLTLGGVVPRALDDLDGLQASEFETYQIFSADDLVFKLIDLQNIKTSRVGLVPEMGIMSPAYIRVEPNKAKINPKFAYWFFTNLYNRCIFNELGGGVRQTISSDELLLLPFPSLPLTEQTQIAAFLDLETEKIDELVEEQRRLMELLKEKRQAVISLAVTKGLNPHVPMKPSGIEWLGEVPAHWEVSRIKYYCSVSGRIGFRGYTTEDQVDEGDGALVLGATHITSLGEINLDKPVYISWEKYYESPEIMVEAADILVVQRGSTCGKVGYVSNNHGPTTINPSLVLLKNFACSPRLIFLYLSSTLVQGLFECVLGSTAIPMLSQEQIGEIAFCLPPLKEQEEIIAYLDNQTAQLDTLTTEAQRAINLLQERRTALISAAVTGQIDVRSIPTIKDAA